MRTNFLFFVLSLFIASAEAQEHVAKNHPVNGVTPLRGTNPTKANRATPNVILIMTDDQGSIDLNSYGATDLRTPNLDRLAREGVKFTQFYSAAPICSPSRAALLTGKTNLRAGLPNNVPGLEHAARTGQYGLPTEQVTMAEMLKQNGYRTALIGKWHLGERTQNLPNAQGFDYFFGHRNGFIDNYSHFYYGPGTHDLYRDSEEIYLPGEHFTDLMVQEVKSEIDKNKDNPFFIYWAFNSPHYPYQGAPKWLEHYKGLPSPRKEYAAFVSDSDEAIGKILDYLDQKGLAENTIIVFQSDNGHSVERMANWGGGDAGPYRGSKFSLFEGGIRLPAIIRYPRKIPAGEVRGQLALQMDWFPTIAELTGSTVTEKIDGKSLLPVIKNKNAKTLHDVVHWQVGTYKSDESQWAVRKGPWKLIGNVIEPMGESKAPELPKLFLVNLEEDVAEKNNLAARHPDKVKELLELHRAWIKQVRAEMKIAE
ncbi:sulfatase-like hydrolase/transferase [Rufibacter sp. XAAS-G3-1]|uniref:sulfatase-like hydrolase/transferase n=1 Tax=Rufibacter sp. XAAS-G3-1 TaxID=2729134 RepID=UPI0015E633B1|nr:sulfatase-like hydrolase/transferase [Rufibacter sp. XAAS-G3-1]